MERRIGVALTRAHIREHQRRLPSGRVVTVKEHEDRRKAAIEEEQAAARPRVLHEPALEVHRAAEPGTIRREMRADVTRMWQMETVSTYTSKNYPMLAVREALQNGADAIRKALQEGQIKQGRFSVDAKETRLILDDNGVGMSSDDIDTKFLTLGGSGKLGEAGAVGGFGVAKAVILGSSSSGSWEMHSRDNYVASDQIGQEVTSEEAKREYRQGTELIIHQPGPWYGWDSFDAIQRVLQSSDVGKHITLEYNGKPVQELYPRRKGKIVELAVDPAWPLGVEVQIKRYSHPGVMGKMVVRINGLYQFDQQFWESVGADYVMDFKVAARPGTAEYPFTKGRDGFTGSAARSFNALRREIERETLSVGKGDDPWEITTFEAHDQRQRETDQVIADFLEDPELESALRRVSDIMREARETPGSIPPDLRKPEQAEVGLPEQAGGGALSFSLGQARSLVKEIQVNRETKNPIQQAWILRRNKKTYGARKKVPIERDIPVLLLWDSMLTMMSEQLRVAKNFKPGLLYDPGTKGLSQRGDDVQGRSQNAILINPEYYPLRQRRDARTMSAKLFNLAAHELGHHVYPGGHTEVWGAGREDIYDRTAWMLPHFEQLARELIPQAKNSRGTPEAKRTVKRTAAANQAKKEARKQQVRHMDTQMLNLWE